MDNFCDDDEESNFFDAEEHIVLEPGFVHHCSFLRNWQYDVWIGAPQSVRDRRRKFIRWMGGSRHEFGGGNYVDTFDDSKCDLLIGDVDRIMENGGAVLRTASSDDEFSSSRSLVSCWNNDGLHLSPRLDLCEHRNENATLNGGNGCIVDEIVENEMSGEVQVMGLEQSLSTEEFEKFPQQSPSVQRLWQEEIDIDKNTTLTGCKSRNRWFSRLRSMTCMAGWNMEDDNVGVNEFIQDGTRIKRVKVRHCQRRLKELSALFTAQDIQAHEGSITAMKFSLDGQYLASAGEDKIVRVWQIVEEERSDTMDIPDADPSCVYFSMNNLSELGPLTVEKDKAKKSNSLRRMEDSACIILPSKVFRILEKPLHVFQGHTGEILDLSWSKTNCLLSSSVDKTVRLWRVGVDHCVLVFPHSDYVTCIQFNPVNDDYFISGSIDGKVRIWQIGGCKVVDWNETRDIITAIAYRPDGQGGIIGSIGGTCCYFDLSDNHLQLGTQMCLSTKKSPCKRITGLQFLPQDPSKVLVTCADSNVRIIDGMSVTTKYKGLRNAGNHTSASFTSNGKHIISASDDSNVYIWNYSVQGGPLVSQPKAIRSFECFSSDASVAITWPGLKSVEHGENSTNSLPFSPSTLSSLSPEYFCDSSSKVSATWPEEKLPKAVKSPISRSQYKLLKTSCQSSSDSHTWGMVIVTAGWDGRIRSFCNYGLPTSL